MKERSEKMSEINWEAAIIPVIGLIAIIIAVTLAAASDFRNNVRKENR